MCKGAGTGSATEAVIKEIGHSYSSYTYTDISPSFFQDAAEIFKDHSAGFIYKTLDIEKDPTQQGYSEGAYDLVVASNVLHATRSLDVTMSNVRKLLRPGGYVVLLEITEVDWLRTGFLFSGISGWWAGANDGRPYGPIVRKGRWDEVFRRTGFSGLDTATPDSKSFMTPFSVMVTQAVDTQMNLIRQPLASTPTKPVIENLLIVGGQQMSTYDLAEQVQNMVAPFCGSVSIVDKLEGLNEDNFSSKHTVLCLAELDEFVFKPFTEEKFKAMQSLIERSSNIIWVVKGARGEQPHSRMMYGIARCLVGERKEGLRFQLIDIDVNEDYDPKILAEALMRLHISESWKSSSTGYDPLWTLEREMFVSNGAVQIPRYKPNKTLDERYNSNKRAIKSSRHLDTDIVEIVCYGASYEVEEYLPPIFEVQANRAADILTIRVKRSVLTALQVKSVGFLYLVIGEDVKTKEKVLAFTKALKSTISIPRTWAIACEISERDERSLLLAAANQLIADSIIGKATETNSFLVHEPTPLLARALSRAASEKKTSVVFTTTKSEDPSFRRIFPSTPRSVIESCIPAGVSVFIDLSTSTDSESIGRRLEILLPAKCKRRNTDAFLSSEGFTRASVELDGVSRALRECYTRSIAELPSADLVNAVENIALKDISGIPTRKEVLRTVDWAASTTALVKTVLAEEKVRFRDDKTYWMIGLTGELGLSLCRWMIERGAKYLVLTSRNPKIDQDWLNAMAAAGAIITIMSM